MVPLGKVFFEDRDDDTECTFREDYPIASWPTTYTKDTTSQQGH